MFASTAARQVAASSSPSRGETASPDERNDPSGEFDLRRAPHLLWEEQFEPLVAEAGPARRPEQFADEHARVDDESHQRAQHLGETWPLSSARLVNTPSATPIASGQGVGCRPGWTFDVGLLLVTQMLVTWKATCGGAILVGQSAVVPVGGPSLQAPEPTRPALQGKASSTATGMYGRHGVARIAMRPRMNSTSSPSLIAAPRRIAAAKSADPRCSRNAATCLVMCSAWVATKGSA